MIHLSKFALRLFSFMVMSYKFPFRLLWIKNAKNLVKKQTLNNNLISWNTVREIFILYTEEFGHEQNVYFCDFKLTFD